jgi:integrase
MRRVPTQARSRSRTLRDDELRAFWKAAEANDDVYGAFVRVALLCGQRRAKLADLRWEDLDGDVWRIRREPREKGAPAVLRLPPAAMKIIASQPRFAGSPFVFTGGHNRAISGFSRRHDAFMARCGVAGFSVHDLRRCCRSLLSRASVQPHVAERVLGHSVGGVVAQTYDRHGYHDEIADALGKLAALIAEIVHGKPGKNVVPLRAPALQP